MNIREIKRRLLIQEVLRYYGLQPDASNRVLCPWHKDRIPSLQIYPSSNSFTCFSSNCTAGSGDVLDVVRLMEGCTVQEAIKKARQIIGGETVKAATPQEASDQQGEPEVVETVEADGETVRLVRQRIWRRWRHALVQSVKAREYMESRKLTGSHIEAGYNSGTFYYGKPEEFLRAALGSGVLLRSNRSGGKEYMAFARECVMFALRDRMGEITGFYGRSIQRQAQEQGRHYYQKNRSGLYPEYPDGRSERLILTESIIDAASLLGSSFVLGSTSVLALYGSNGFTEEHREAIESLSELREIVLFFDGDEAGRHAVAKWSVVLQKLRPEATITVVQLPDSEDVNSILVKYGDKALSDLYHSRQAVVAESQEHRADEQKKITTEAVSVLHTENPLALRWQSDIALYTVLGGVRAEADSMKVTLKVEGFGGGVHRIKADLYHDEQTEKVLRRTSEKLALRVDLLERDVANLTDLLEQYREQQQKQNTPEQTPVVRMSTRERTEALALLRRKNLYEHLHSLIGESGVVGEEENRLLAFCCCASYKSGRPLHLISQGASGQGKTHLQEAIARLMPSEDVIQVTRVSEYGFYHFGEHELSYKLFISEDLDGMGEEALLALREMQSKGWIAGVVTVKDEKGNFITRQKVVRGPLATAGATTRGYVYEDNSSRCFVIAIDESEEQTRRIIEYQNRLYAGKIDTVEQQKIQRLVQNCVRLLEPFEVINPYAEHLTLPQSVQKRRRTNAHYHELIKVITWVHQYQRKRDERGRLVTEKEDISIANRLVAGALVAKSDDLDGSLRHFFEGLKSHIKAVGGKDYRTYVFGRKEVRERLRISKSQQHRYLNDLEELDYIRRTSGTAYGGYRYRVEVWDDAEADRLRIMEHLSEQFAQI